MRRTLAVLVLLAWPCAAFAQRDPNLDLAAEADLHFTIGVELQQRGDFRGALEHYLMSNRLAFNKNVVFNIARCFEELGRLADAHRYYSDYLEVETNEADRRLAQEAIERIGRRVALIRVETSPPGANVFLNRTDLGSRGLAPCTLAVEPGEYTVIVQREGHEPAQGQTRAVRGEVANVRLTLSPILATIEIVGEPAGAVVRVDDPATEPIGTVPGALPILPGQHTLLISAEGYQTAHIDVRLEPRERIVRSIDLELQTGSVMVDVQERGALIEVDGTAMGFTPSVLPRVPSGAHTIRISRPGFRPFEESIRVEPNQQTSVRVRLRLEQEVTAASRRAESVFDAPASVSIIPQEELRAFGYQTIWDALGGVRGIYQTYDHSYVSLGFRGFSQPQDYGNRVLALTNGHVMNDDLLGSSYVGYDARSDLIDVERIEVVRGPGSALYGTNAFFGVINLVTRDRDTLLRPHASLATEGLRMGRLRVGGGTRITPDVGFWASGSGVLSQGEDLYLPELAPASDGVVRGADGFYSATLAARGWAGDFTLEAYYNRRRKQIPTGAFDTIVGDPRAHNTDSRGFVELRWDPRFSPEVGLSARAFLDYYEYSGGYPYDPVGTADPETGVVRDHWLGYWVGGETRLVLDPVEWLNITAGAEVRGSAVADLSSEDVTGRYLEESVPLFIFGAYAVGEVTPVPWLTAHVGGRFDYVAVGQYADYAPNFRASVILRPWDTGIFKLIGGSAFRVPSVYELRYNDGGVTQVAPDSLRPERIYTGELEFTQRIEEELSAIVSVFYNYIESPITTEAVPTNPDLFRYANSPDIAQTLGGEAEIRREWREGWMVSASYSYQHTRIGDLLSDAPEARLTNSPEHLASFRGAAPIVEELLTLALRLRIESPRLGLRTFADGTQQLVEGDVPLLADVTISGEITSIGLSYALGIRNIFDWQYRLPGGEDIAIPFVPQSGRSVYFETALRF